MKYDIIGDIHGHADELEELLGKLGYKPDAKGVHEHSDPNRQAIFVGDFVDRGPGQFRALTIARDMIAAGRAQATMGNHELNAGMYHTHVEKAGDLIPLRAHSEKNNHQHRAFLDAHRDDPAQGRKHVDWMKNLPLFLELDGLRVVHAVWDDEAIALLRRENVIDEQNRIRPDKWELASDYKAPVGAAIEKLTKGIEVELPSGVSFNDAEGTQREKARLKWWANPDAPELTLDKVLLDVPKGALPDMPVPDNIRDQMRTAQKGSNTVFFGHYWQRGETPTVETVSAVCLDQSVAKGGHLAAATITVEQGKIADMNFTSVVSRGKAAAHGHAPAAAAQRY